MRKYELVLIAESSLSDKDRKETLEKVTKALGDVKITKTTELGQKPLAYKIGKDLSGYYYLLNLESEEGVGKNVEMRIGKITGIVRYLLLKTK